MSAPPLSGAPLGNPIWISSRSEGVAAELAKQTWVAAELAKQTWVAAELTKQTGTYDLITIQATAAKK